MAIARLSWCHSLRYWNRDGREHRLFFTQREAVETIIFLTEARSDLLQGIRVPSDPPLRVSELVGLDWSDFCITGDGIVVSVVGKGSRSRQLLLPAALWQELQALQNGDGAVFRTCHGNRLDRQNVHRILKTAAAKAGIDERALAHWLRHAHACHSLARGAKVDLVMHSLGHSSLAVTSKYLHIRPHKLGILKAKLHRPIEGKIKTVTVSMTPSGRYCASILCELEGDTPSPSPEGKVAGVDFGLKDFAIVNDGVKTSKYANPRHLEKHERNLARKQKKLARKSKGSRSREKARRLVARVHERLSNARQDYLHKLSRKLVNDNQVIVVENLNVKGMVRNHSLAKAISDVGWGMFVNFLSYKLEREGKVLVEIDRFFPSSKTCSEYLFQVSEMPLEVRVWDCPHCGAHHDRDENAAKNIRAEGIRMLTVSGTGTAADGGNVRPKRGRKSVLRQFP